MSESCMLWLEVIHFAAGRRPHISLLMRHPHGVKAWLFPGPDKPWQVGLSAGVWSCSLCLVGFLSTGLDGMVAIGQHGDPPCLLSGCFSAQTLALLAAHIEAWLSGKSLVCKVCSNWGTPSVFSLLTQWLALHGAELLLPPLLRGFILSLLRDHTTPITTHVWNHISLALTLYHTEFATAVLASHYMCCSKLRLNTKTPSKYGTPTSSLRSPKHPSM